VLLNKEADRGSLRSSVRKEHIEELKQNSPKCYWIKKQIKVCCDYRWVSNIFKG